MPTCPWLIPFDNSLDSRPLRALINLLLFYPSFLLIHIYLKLWLKYTSHLCEYKISYACVGRPLEQEVVTVPNCCGRCFTPIYQGCRHQCNQTSMIQNIMNNAPQQVQRRVASAVTREVVDETGSSDISLPTAGRPLSLSVGPPKKDEQLHVTHEDMDHLQGTYSLSGNQTVGGMINTFFFAQIVF